MTTVEAASRTGMFIGGSSVEGDGLDSTQVRNPASAVVIGVVPRGGAREAELAVEQAHAAFPAWWETPAAKRGELLARAAAKVHERIDELSVVLTLEQGKPLRESRIEIVRCV